MFLVQSAIQLIEKNWKPRLNAGMVKYWKTTRRSVQSKNKINNQVVGILYHALIYNR